MDHQYKKARELDNKDPLAGFRQRFHIPENTIYMDGNSLGLLSTDAEHSLHRVMNEWKTLGIKGWTDSKRPWFHFAEGIGEMASGLVGAAPGELILSGSTTVNIHALISTFYRPDGKRNCILADELNFPSDIYALKGQIKQKELDPQEALLLAKSTDGHTLDEDRIVSMMTPDVALVWLPSVLYASGQLLDMEYLTRKAHARGIPIGFDCSHSAGAIPHSLSQWGVDFATFCSYKYMNGGPGSPAFLYLNRRHFQTEPLMAGWFGYQKDKQFDMSLHFEPTPSAGGWQIGTPNILSAAALEGSLQLILEAGIERIRDKSLGLTAYLMELIEEELAGLPHGFSVVTPTEPRRRGGHIALTHPTEAFRINQAMKARGIIPDFRTPGIIRIAPVAMYNSFMDIWETVSAIREIMNNREYLACDRERGEVS